MPTTLLTSLGEFDAAIDRLLSLATTRLDIFDGNLAALKLDRPARLVHLERLLGAQPHQVRMVVQDSAAVLAGNPRLVKLMELHAHHFSIIQAADPVLELTDSMLIGDDAHALIRFHRDHPRGKLIESDASAVHPYRTRFASIINEGGHPVSARVAGL